MNYLLDTNIISELIRSKPNGKVIAWIKHIPNESLYISVLTLGEIRKGIEKLTGHSRQQKLKIWLEHELPDWFENRILPIDRAVADRWGRLQGKIRSSLPAIDSLLAATALHYDLSLVTRNEKDFASCGVEIINPF